MQGETHPQLGLDLHHIADPVGAAKGAEAVVAQGIQNFVPYIPDRPP